MHNEPLLAILCAAWGTSCPNQAKWEFTALSPIYASMYSCDQHIGPVMELYFQRTGLDAVQVKLVAE